MSVEPTSINRTVAGRCVSVVRNDTSTRGTSDTDSRKPELKPNLRQRFVHIALTIEAYTNSGEKISSKVLQDINSFYKFLGVFLNDFEGLIWY